MNSFIGARLAEAKDLNLYTKLLATFAKFVDDYPGTGMGKIYNKLLRAGMKSVPKDKRAVAILASVMKCGGPKAIQELMNTRLIDLPITIRPIYKDGNAKRTAFFHRDGKTYSQVKDLLNLEGEGTGTWSDENGNKVSLIELEDKNI
jgi:hypothetical protein